MSNDRRVDLDELWTLSAVGTQRPDNRFAPQRSQLIT
jgi:hypothetical protein